MGEEREEGRDEWMSNLEEVLTNLYLFPTVFFKSLQAINDKVTSEPAY